MSFFKNRRYNKDKLYLYGHYGFYDSMYKTADKIAKSAWCEKTIYSIGLNYFPIKEVVIKAEYMMRKFKAPFNDEPTISFGIAYSGLFVK